MKENVPFDECLPNATTVAALEELERGEGEVVDGPTGQLFDGLQ
jgi:antitoxin component of RelBE/YafQ-DinJ toxin-antitoxin module